MPTMVLAVLGLHAAPGRCDEPPRPRRGPCPGTVPCQVRLSHGQGQTPDIAAVDRARFPAARAEPWSRAWSLQSDGCGDATPSAVSGDRPRTWPVAAGRA